MALHEEAAHMQHLLDRLAHAANTVVTRLYATLGGDFGRLVENYAPMVTPFLTASANIGAEWYHRQAPDSGFPVRLAPPPPPADLQASVKWAIGEAVQSAGLSQQPPNPLEDLAGATERHVYDANRDTIVANANRENVMFARYASSTACAFCRILATRGPVYSGKGVITDPDTGKQKLVVVGVRGRPKGTRKIGTEYHDNCKCLAVPVRPGEVYHPPDYVDDWQSEYETAVKDHDTQGFKDIVNHMRRQEYHHEKLVGALGGISQEAEPPTAPSVFSGLSQD